MSVVLFGDMDLKWGYGVDEAMVDLVLLLLLLLLLLVVVVVVVEVVVVVAVSLFWEP